MPSVKDLMALKDARVVSVGPDATVHSAAIVMGEHRIGSLLVKEGERVLGMFTERDVLHRVVAEQRDPANTRVGDVMSTEIVGCTPNTDIEEVRSAFKNRRIRHMPVMDGEQKVIGLISIGDLNAYLSAAQEHTIYLLHEYLYGRT
jgi:CBS domain-containing protein